MVGNLTPVLWPSPLRLRRGASQNGRGRCAEVKKGVGLPGRFRRITAPHLQGRKRTVVSSSSSTWALAVPVVVEDLRETFLTDFVFPTLRAGAIYERKYLLGTSMARPLIAQQQVKVAEEFGAGDRAAMRSYRAG